MSETVKRLVLSGFTPGQAAGLEETFPEVSRDGNGRVNGLVWEDSHDPLTAHPYYHFHGFAGSQVAGDGKFFDLAAGNHAVRGANLSDAQLFATAGYVSTIDPASGLTDSVLRIPFINFDYAGGETLIVWCLGKWLAEGASTHLMGDGYHASFPGWLVWVPTSKKLQIVLYSSTSAFSGSSAADVFDGNLHSFAFILSGQTKKYCLWVDDTIDANFSSGYTSFGNGVAFDTRNTNTINIGSTSPAPGNTTGIATATRALAIWRLPSGYPLPEPETFTQVFRQLRANPGKLVLASAF